MPPRRRTRYQTQAPRPVATVTNRDTPLPRVNWGVGGAGGTWTLHPAPGGPRLISEVGEVGPCGCCRVMPALRGEAYCRSCRHGHEPGVGGHQPRTHCMCCGAARPLTEARCLNCRECPPGQHVEGTTRSENSPEIHNHVCSHCGGVVLCDCDRNSSFSGSFKCGLDGEGSHWPPTSAKVHMHNCQIAACGRAIRCRVDDKKARLTCLRCQENGWTATQERTEKSFNGDDAV